MQEKIPLLIPIQEKDLAKEVKTPQGGRILWDREKEEWFWPVHQEERTPVPKELKRFIYPGKGPVLDTVVTIPLQEYRLHVEGLNQARIGRLRWDLPLQRAIWRGKGQPPQSLKSYLPRPKSQEELATYLINREKIKTRGKPKIKITIVPWDEKSREDEIVISPTGDLLPENIKWLFPANESQELKGAYQDRLPHIRITQTPEDSYRSKEGLRMLDLVRLAPQTTIHLPQGKDTPPLQTFHCLPELERKYRRSLQANLFPKVLQSFGIEIQQIRLKQHWNPNPEKDSFYIKSLLT